MSMTDEWVPFSWHCVNCGNIVTGYKNSRGDIKVECKKCRTVMVRTLKNRKQDNITVYAPPGQERIEKSNILV